MNGLVRSISDWFVAVWTSWNRFWFTPQQPHTLALVRILGGAMLLYTHLIWFVNQSTFLGANSWLDANTTALLNTNFDGSNYTWSYLFYVESPVLLGVLNFAACAVFLMLTLGLFTRVTSILGCLITLAYCHRLTGSLYGLDQINAVMATYLMLGRCGDVWSLDRWLAERRGDATPIQPTTSTTIAIRLLQLHLCVIYLYGGIGKARGELWWDGSACWFAIANLEYRSVDLTWLVRYPWFIALLTHITLFWEVFYCFFVWSKLTRPICIGLAIAVHLGIALFLGMPTFGLAMIIANLSFVYPETVAAVVGLRWLRGAEHEAEIPLKQASTSPRKTKFATSDATLDSRTALRKQLT